MMGSLCFCSARKSASLFSTSAVRSDEDDEVVVVVVVVVERDGLRCPSLDVRAFDEVRDIVKQWARLQR